MRSGRSWPSALPALPRRMAPGRETAGDSRSTKLLEMLTLRVGTVGCCHGAAARAHDPRWASNTGSRMPDRWFGSGSVEELADRLPHPVVRSAGRSVARDRKSPPGGPGGPVDSEVGHDQDAATSERSAAARCTAEASQALA